MLRFETAAGSQLPELDANDAIKTFLFAGLGNKLSVSILFENDNKLEQSAK